MNLPDGRFNRNGAIIPRQTAEHNVTPNGEKEDGMMISDQELDKRLSTLKAIWFAMLASLAIYMFVGLQVAENLRVSLNHETFGVLRTVLYTVAVVTLIITRYLKRLFLSAKGEQQTAIQIDQLTVLQKYSTAMIVTWSLSESVGIYGFVLFLLGKNTVDLYLLTLISAGAMILYRPRKDEVTDLLRKSWEAA
jgi:F0F1-type ATP synthase membrane subunit c/vacuolar-type H+-ATPase subunit K